MERTVEGELAPMAEELGLGILPWSPLKMGALSGKYTRANGQKMLGMRGAFVGELKDKDYDIIDQLQAVATGHKIDGPTIALAWVQGKPGVSSTIIGARTIEHLESNLKALEIKLTPEQVEKLDAVSKPVLNFPADFNRTASPNYQHAGATMNGVTSKAVPNVPTEDSKRY